MKEKSVITMYFSHKLAIQQKETAQSKSVRSVTQNDSLITVIIKGSYAKENFKW